MRGGFALIVILLLLAGGALLAYGCSQMPPTPAPANGIILPPNGSVIGAKAGIAVTDVDLPALKTEVYKLRKSKLLLVEVWGSWCGPCREQTPKTLAIQAKYKDTLNLLLISVAEPNPQGPTNFLARLPVGEGVTAVNYTGDLGDLKKLLNYPGYVPYLVLTDSRGAKYEFSEDTLKRLLE